MRFPERMSICSPPEPQWAEEEWTPTWRASRLATVGTVTLTRVSGPAFQCQSTPQRQPFFHAAHRQPARPLVYQRPRHLHRAMAISIGFHHRAHFHIRTG